jgi:PAS domain S-box-containing protein
MAEMLGYSPEEMIGRVRTDFVDENHKAYSDLRMEKGRQGIDEVHGNKLVRKDGSFLWMLINSKSLFDKDGKFTGILALLTDITEREQTETFRETINSVNQTIHTTLDFNEIMMNAASEASKIIGCDTRHFS